MSLRTPDEVKHVLEHLPIESERRPPWSTYLASIYGQVRARHRRVLREIEVLYPDLLPANSSRRSLPPCSSCKGWQSGVKTQSVDASRFFLTALPRAWNAPFRSFVGIQRRDAPVPSHTWVEIVRVFNDGSFSPRVRAEGSFYGCWAWTARGSGVFASTARSLSFPSRYAAARNFSKRFGYGHHDASFANATRRLGYDTLQVMHGSAELFRARFRHPLSEIVLTYAGCHGVRRISGACMPGVDLRTGFDASESCVCDEKSPILRCLE